MIEPRLPEDRNWVASTGLSRRATIVGSAFAAGFAAACQPVSATTLQTSGEGVADRMVTIDTDGFATPAYVAHPAGGKNVPVILVVHEIFGLHEWVKDICRRLAKAGYYAIAPDLFAREGDATKISDIKQLVDTIVSKAPDARVMADLDATAAWAKADGGDTSHLGITGFCWGGRTVWLYAAHNPALGVGVAWYGRLTGDTDANKPKNPIDLAAQMKAPVLGLYGGQDKGIPASDVHAMEEKLKAADKPARLIVYPEADHGFLADYRPSYNPEASKAGWQEMLAWFGRYLEKEGARAG